MAYTTVSKTVAERRASSSLAAGTMCKLKPPKGIIVEFSKFDIKMFEQARQEAEKSDYLPFKLGSVVAYKGHIVGRGHNTQKTAPQQCRYNNKYRKFNNSNKPVRHSLHAEMSAMLNVPYPVGKDMDWNKASIYIYRISPGKLNGFGCAKPCPACLHAILDMGIKKLYYTDDVGYTFTKLN